MEAEEQNLRRILDAAQAAGLVLDDYKRWPHDAEFVISSSGFLTDSFAANPALLQDLLGSDSFCESSLAMTKTLKNQHRKAVTCFAVFIIHYDFCAVCGAYSS